MRNYELTQPMRIQARPGSEAEKAYWASSLPGGAWPMPKAIANGIDPAPLEDLIFHGGKVVAKMEFQNVYLGDSAAWNASDVKSIDAAILRAMQHKELNNVMAQYFPGRSPECDGRKSMFFANAKVVKFSEEDVQRLVTSMYDASAIDKSDLDSCIFNLLLPAGSVLTLGQASSLGGLGGYHGSVHINRGGKDVTLHYSASVFSQHLADGRENGIDVFDAPWKNVVGTLYHEINEFRTDADVNDAIEKQDNDFLGWNSRSGREVGDQPIFKAGPNLHLVFQEVSAHPGPNIPVQFLYSNAVHGAEGPVPHPLA